MLFASILLMAGIVENAKDIAADLSATTTEQTRVCTSDLIKLHNWKGWNPSNLSVTVPSPYSSQHYCSSSTTSDGGTSAMCGLLGASLFLLLQSLSPSEGFQPYVYINENDTKLWTPVKTTMAGVPYLLADRVVSLTSFQRQVSSYKSLHGTAHLDLFLCSDPDCTFVADLRNITVSDDAEQNAASQLAILYTRVQNFSAVLPLGTWGNAEIACTRKLEQEELGHSLLTDAEAGCG